MGSSAPPINRSLADLQDLLAAAQENWTTTQANLVSENATHASTIGPLQVQLGTLNAQIIYFDQQASSGTQMDPEAAASQAAAARAALLTCQAAIVSENQRHATAFQEANTANASAVLAVQTYQRQIQQIYDAVAVTISPKPSSIAPNASVDFTATVENDIDSAGVTWWIGGDLNDGEGTLSNITSTSVTYTAPAEPIQDTQRPPRINPQLILFATSVANSARNDQALFEIPIPFPPGYDPNENPWYRQ